MEHEPVERELTLAEQELATRWQIYPDMVRNWVDTLGLNAESVDTAAEWAVKENHFELVMQAKREFFEDSLFPEKFRS